MSPSSPPTEPVHLAVIIASTRDGRRGPVVADWFTKAVADRTDLTVDLIDLLDVDLPERFTREPHVGVAEFRARLAAADAFVVVTPEYNHSFPAALKEALDFAKEEYRRKAVGFVSYGGVSGGLRAVEQLRQVFAELHVHGVRDSVSFHGPWNGFGDDDLPRDAEGARAAAELLADELVWWGSALRAARRAAA